MKLFYSPGACSLSPHIVACERGIALQLEKVDLRAKTTASGGDYLVVNPKGYVPALQLDNGEVLTEGPAVTQFLAEQADGAPMAPAAGPLERYRILEMLVYINSEIHKSYGPLFNPAVSAAVREEKVAYLAKRYALVEQRLASSHYLVGDHFTAADAYLYTVTRWADKLKVDLSWAPHLAGFQKRIGSRPAVQRALSEEGLS